MMDHISLDPDYWLCPRCNSYKHRDEFFGVRPSSPGTVREYKLCASCRQPLKGSKGITRLEHERRKAERLARRGAGDVPTDD